MPDEKYPMVIHAWEAINHGRHTWNNSYNIMEQKITGQGQGFDKGIEVSSVIGFPGMAGWFGVTATRSPIYKFNRSNFDFNMHNPNGGGSGYPSVSGGLGGFFGGDPRMWCDPPDDAFNPLIRIEGQSRVRTIIR